MNNLTMNLTAYFALFLSFSSLGAATTDIHKYVYVTPKEEPKCPSSVQPCYTLTQINENPTRYFRHNTTVVLLPGTHTVDFTSETEIEGASNIALVGSTEKVSRIQCTAAGEFGFAFVNITNLTISNIWISDCSAPQLWRTLQWHIIYAKFQSKWLLQDYNIIFNGIPAALYLIQVSDVTILTLKITNSRGAGLLGINVFGNTSITNSSFTKNVVNCYFQFMDAEKYPVHTVLQIEDTNFEWGKTYNYPHAAGLSIIMAQSSYTIMVKIINVTTYGNEGAFQPYGNLLIQFDECNTYHIEIIIQGLSCAHSGIGNRDYKVYNEGGIVLQGDASSTDSNCSYFQHPIHISNSYFSHNTPAITISMIRGKLVIFENVSIFQNNGNEFGYGSFSVTDSNVLLKNVNFTNNEITAAISQSTIIFHNTNFFKNNGHWGALYMQSSNLTMQGKTAFIKNKGRIGGAIYLDNSTLVTEGSIEFLENEGYDGGAIAFHGDSILRVGAQSKVKFIGNHAVHQGGAIYVYNAIDPSDVYILRSQKTSLFPQITCFYQPYNKDTITTSTAPVVLENNTADNAGSAVFGGWVDICNGKWLYTDTLLFDTMFKITNNLTDLSQISSTPIIVCICINSTPNCANTSVSISAYPGQTFYISAVAVGQRLGIVPTIIRSVIVPTESTIPSTLETLQYSQNVGRICTQLSYTVRSSRKQEMIILSVDESIHQENIRKRYAISETILPDIFIHLQLKICPKGFIFDNSSCVCDPILQKHDISCDINNQRIHRQPLFWIYAIDSEETSSLMGNVLVHEHCPFDYCKPYSLNLSLENPDEQCAFHRSGILCGTCQHNLSHVLGSSNCKECSSLWLILFIPAFAVAGIALVIFLMVLNLTVSTGTINGLIFYANIVRANQAIFFPHNANNSFLSWFIAWVNLDLGTEACFYSGLDAYAKTWLQFVFPVYIWLVVILIIVSSYYSVRASKLSGRNAVQVLATLFLLSYAKMLRITITVFSSTTLEYPDGSVRRVWLYDGNVDYLKGKHVPLFMAALLVLLVLSLPYTALLLFIQCLQLKSNYRLLLWIGKFKPLFDAYTGPYKDKHRYWTGFLLLVRAVLFLIFSVNVFGNPAINLLTIVATVFFLFIKAVVSKDVYKLRYLNILEYVFILNLGTLSAASLYTRLTDGNQAALTYTSVSIAFVTFCGVALYHTKVRIAPHQEFCKYSINELRSKLLRARQNHEVEEPDNVADPPKPQQVSVTYIQLREPLMEHCDGK